MNSCSIRFTIALMLAAPVGGRVVPLHAQTDPEWLTTRMSTWFQHTRRSAPGEWGVAIADQSGQLLWSNRAERPLMPASTVKLFTTGFARTVLGGSARRATRVVGEGSLTRPPASGSGAGHLS